MTDQTVDAIPAEAVEASTKALLNHARDWHEDGSVTCQGCGYVDDESYGWPRHQAAVALEAALPFLTEAATRTGYALGRARAAEEIAAECERHQDDALRAMESSGSREDANAWDHIATGYMRSAELARGKAKA